MYVQRFLRILHQICSCLIGYSLGSWELSVKRLISHHILWWNRVLTALKHKIQYQPILSLNNEVRGYTLSHCTLLVRFSSFFCYFYFRTPAVLDTCQFCFNLGVGDVHINTRLDYDPKSGQIRCVKTPELANFHKSIKLHI